MYIFICNLNIVRNYFHSIVTWYQSIKLSFNTQSIWKQSLSSIKVGFWYFSNSSHHPQLFRTCNFTPYKREFFCFWLESLFPTTLFPFSNHHRVVSLFWWWVLFSCSGFSFLTLFSLFQLLIVSLSQPSLVLHQLTLIFSMTT